MLIHRHHVDVLEERIIEDYFKALHELQKGYKPSLDKLMDQFIFLEIYHKLSNNKLLYYKLSNEGL